MDESSGNGSYTSLDQAFLQASRKSFDDDPKRARIYKLLSDACSMDLSPDDENGPFKPIIVTSNWRSAVVEDFSEEDISFFSSIITEVTNTRLKARLADLVWLRGSKKDLVKALIAIDSYRQIPLDAETWFCDGRNCWYRALGLAIMLRSGIGNRIQEMESNIQEAFDSSKVSDEYYALELVDLMAKFRLGKDRSGDIAEKLRLLAQAFERDGDLSRAQEYFNSSSTWYKFAGDKIKSIEMTVCHAEALVKEAIVCTATEQPNNMLAASLYERAIHVFRTIPKTERPSFKVDERIDELNRSMNNANQLSLNEMRVISSGEIDITHMIEYAKSAVSGKSLIDALRAFVNLFQGMCISEMQVSTIDQLKSHPLSFLLPSTLINHDGRVIAKARGVSPNEALDGKHPNVHAWVMKNHRLQVDLAVKGFVLPALKILHLEHQIHRDDFMRIVKKSPFVPPGRELLFVKGLHSGYCYDYATALHLLSPQIEHLVRFHLKKEGAKTSTLDKDGIENENGLNTLVALPEMKTVFGDDLTFEIKALFCDPFGGNLRNEIAHGLIDDKACNSTYSVYAWWLTLKIVFLTFLYSDRQQFESAAEGDNS